MEKHEIAAAVRNGTYNRSSLDIARAAQKKILEARERILQKVLRTKSDERNLVRIHEGLLRR